MSGHYEVGKSGTYTASGFTPANGLWDEGQYQSAIKKTVDKLLRSSLKEVAWVGELIGWPAERLMKDFAGHGARTLDDLNIWHPAWDDPQHREFGWENVDALGAAAAVTWSIAKAAYKYPGLLMPQGGLLPGGLGPFIEKATEIYSDEVQTFGKNHPKAVDEIIKAFGAEPFLLLGPLVKLSRAPKLARDMKAIAAIVNEARTSKQGVLALANLSGAPLTPTLLKAVSAGKNTPEQAAELLYSHGLRPVVEGQDFMAGVRFPYFRKAGSLFPEEMRDLAMEWPHVKEAAWAEHRAAIEKMREAIKDIDPEDVKDIARILDELQRPEWMTAKQHGQLIRSEMAQRILTGRGALGGFAENFHPDRLPAIKGGMVRLYRGESPLPVDEAQKLAQSKGFPIEFPEALRGRWFTDSWQKAMEYATTNAYHKGKPLEGGKFFYVDVPKADLSKMASGDAYTLSEKLSSQKILAGTFTEGRVPSGKSIEAAAIYGEMTKLGHAKNSPYLSNYSPGNKEKGSAWDGIIRAATGHHKPRLTGNRLIADFEEFQKWAMEVFLRENKPANTPEAAKAFLRKAQTAMTGLPYPQIETTEALRKFSIAVESRKHMLRGLKGAAEKAGEANQVERFENAITQTTALGDAIEAIGVKNPAVIQDENLLKRAVLSGLSYIRMGQTLFNPGWYTANFLEGSARTALTTGELVADPVRAFARGHAPIRGINAELMDFTHGNIRHQSNKALRGAAKWLGEVSDRIERTNQQLLGGIHYEKKVAFYQSQGSTDEIAHALAKSDALNEVRRIFPDYGDASSFINDMAPYFTYLKYNVYYNTEPILKWAAAHPSEAVFANNMLEIQYKTMTSDRYGNVKLPGKDLAVNPIDSSGARRIARLLATPDSVINEGDMQAAKLMKLAQVATGSLVAPIHWTQNQLGLISEHSPEISIPAFELAGDLTRHFTGSSPRMIASGMVTGELKESPDFFRDMEINNYMAGQKLSGQPVTAHQASDEVDRVAKNNSLWGFLTGIRPVLMTEGMAELQELKRYYDEDLGKLPNAEVAREKMREDIPALNGVVTVQQSTDDRIRNAVEKLKQAQYFDEQVPVLKEATDFEREKMLKAAPSGVYEKLLDLWDIGAEKAGDVIQSIKENVSVIENAQTRSGEAQAADISSGTWRPLELTRAKGGKFIVAIDQSVEIGRAHV